jgi:hypothetical protein
MASTRGGVSVLNGEGAIHGAHIAKISKSDLCLDESEGIQPGRWIFASTHICKRPSPDNNDPRPDTKR